MKAFKIIGLCLIAVVLFPYEWLMEQPSALRMAYYRTFLPAKDMIIDVLEGRR